MAYQTLGEAVLAAHRAEQARSEREQLRVDANGGHCVQRPVAPQADQEATEHGPAPLWPTWVVWYFLANRAR